MNSHDECDSVPLFESIAAAEMKVARAEHDLDEVRLERNIAEGQATDYGRMEATSRGEWLINEANRRFESAFDVWARAKAELTGLLDDLNNWGKPFW